MGISCLLKRNQMNTQSFLNKSIIVIDIMTIIVLAVHLWGLYSIYPFFYALAGGEWSSIFTSFILPQLPYLILWSLIIIVASMKKKQVLVAFPCISYSIYTLETEYLFKNFNLTRGFTLSAQLFALFSTLLVAFGCVVFVVWVVDNYKRGNKLFAET